MNKSHSNSQLLSYSNSKMALLEEEYDEQYIAKLRDLSAKQQKTILALLLASKQQQLSPNDKKQLKGQNSASEATHASP